MDSSARSTLFEHFLSPAAETDRIDEEIAPAAAAVAVAVTVPAALEEVTTAPAEVETSEEVADVEAELTAEAGGEGTAEPVEDADSAEASAEPAEVSAEPVEVSAEVVEETAEVVETSAEPVGGAAEAVEAPAEAVAEMTEIVEAAAEAVEEAAEVVEAAQLRVEEEGGRVWLHVPGDASLESVAAGLSAVALPGGVLWLGLGALSATAAEIGELCALVSAGLERPVAGVRMPRGMLAAGVERSLGVAVELEGAAPAAAEEPEAGRGRQVLVVERTLRSGGVVRWRGDVLVYGDVNAGAEIEAGGNIIVLGALRGLAWAGTGGDESAMIISFDLRPVQLRIGRQIAFMPEQSTRPRSSARGAEVAVVRDGQIVLQEYRGRLSG